MNPSHKITLKAFLIALAQQQSPLPADFQAQLKAIANQIENNLNNMNGIINIIDELEAIASQPDSPIADIYNNIYTYFLNPAAQRQKGPIRAGMDAQLKENTEHENIAVSVNDTALIQTTQNILKQANIVDSARKSPEVKALNSPEVQAYIAELGMR